MAEKFEMSADLTIEQTRVAMMLFSSCYQHAIVHMTNTLGPAATADFHRSVIHGLKNIDASMPLDDESKATTFVVTLLQGTIGLPP